MYRQRKRDLNLKPNRQLDKRSSRGMIYENEELRMRTIAICEDVDRGQSDIKKLRKENDHLKREIWGLRDECDKLEVMLKKVCISANIPEIQLESSSKTGDDDEDDGDEDYEDEDEDGSHAEDDVPPDKSSDKKFLKAGSSSRERRGSGTSVGTFDSDVGSYISNMFGDGEDQQQIQQEDIAFAGEDSGSAILNPFIEPVPGTSASMYQHPSWQPHHTSIPPDLEAVREETESNLNSPATPLPPPTQLGLHFDEEVMALPDPNMVIFPPSSSDMDGLAEGRKTPVIHITPASSPTSNSNGETNSSETEELPNVDPLNLEQEIVQNAGCITVVPKTFKVTSEIVVGNGKEETKANNEAGQPETNVPCKSAELPRKTLKFYHTNRQDPSSFPSSEITDRIVLGGGTCQRRSCYYPAGAMPLPSSAIHRSFGILGYCCCNNDLLMGGYQSEPSLTSSPSGGVGKPSEEQAQIHSSATSFFNTFCCRVPPPTMITAPPIALKSVWNTVDKNIVIGFYGYSTGGGGEEGVADAIAVEPKVQDIIDELEAQFDPTLENILGIRLISPGRIFISLKNVSIVKAFLHHFKNDLILKNKQNPNQRIRIHFIEGTTTKLTTTLILSGIPQELSDLSVISALNQFGQVVAPLERRNYKGIDISERIAKMHLVITESSVPEVINISGYEVKIRPEPQAEKEDEANNNKILTHGQQAASGDLQPSAAPPQPSIVLKQPQRKYGFIHPSPPTITTTATTTAVVSGPSASALKPHKPVIRSSSSAPRLETPAPGTLTCPLPPVEHKRHSSVCVGNIPPEQHPSKLPGKSNIQQQTQQHKVTIAQAQTQGQASSTPNLQPPPKKPLARLLASSPGSFTPSPVSSPGSPVDNMIVHKSGAQQNQSQKEGPLLKAFYRSFEPGRRTSESRSHAPLTPTSSCSPRTRRKSSVQFAGVGKGKKEPLPWCGCWGLGCG